MDIQEHHIRLFLLALIFLASFFIDEQFFEISGMSTGEILNRMLGLGLVSCLLFFGGLAANIFFDPTLAIKDILLLKGVALWTATSYVLFGFFLRFLVNAIWVIGHQKSSNESPNKPGSK